MSARSPAWTTSAWAATTTASTSSPTAWTTCPRYPVVIAALRDRGWSDADCGALTSGNILRVLRDAESAAARLAAERGPSAATIDDLDAPAAEA